MADVGRESRGRGTRLQGDFILFAARTLYFWAACVVFVAAVAGLVAIAYFEVIVWKPVPLVNVPPPYKAQPGRIDLDVMEEHLAPPKNLHFKVLIEYIDQPLGGIEPIGYFAADTPNGLAEHPDDFQVVDGGDSEFFELVEGGYRLANGQRRTALRPADALVRDINELLWVVEESQTREFEITVYARDVYGIVSGPQTVNFTLEFGPPKVTVADTAMPDGTESEEGISELQRLAAEIALVVDPGKTPDYFQAYGRAVELPQRCGARSSDDEFVSNYRLAFERVRSDLAASNIEAFYTGVCEAWRQYRDVQRRERQKAEAARNEARADNHRRLANAEVDRVWAATNRNFTLMFVGSAIALFMVISLFLAFLAIESHSRAIRRASEVLAERENRKV